MYMKKGKKLPYFEGWYYKQVDATTQHTISFIPSVSFNKDSSTAYIQAIYQNGDDLTADICEYDITAFKTADDVFQVSVDQSHFSDKGIDIDFGGEKLSIEGEIRFSDLVRLDYSRLRPNIMGAFSYLPFMQCNHGVISMRHDLSGSLNINGEDVVFDDGVGYIEKDWGSSFPKDYIWMQCGHFDEKDTTSLFFSAAHVPFPFRDFRGFLCNLLLDGEQYRFATYTGAKLDMQTSPGKVDISIRDKQHKLGIVAVSKDTKELLAPIDGEMSRKIRESLKGSLAIELINRRDGSVIYQDKSSHASIEVIEAEKSDK